MKFQLVLIAAALALSSAAAPAIAGSADRYDAWEQRLRARVNALHTYPAEAKAGAMGDVLVAFRINAEGRPADITIRQSSGEAAFDAAAVRLVSQLGKLGPVPSKGSVRQIELKLSYGEPATFTEGTKRKKADREERVANERRNRLIVARATRLAEKRP